MEVGLNLYAGEIVEVLSKEEILTTLDRNGRYENVPFMPEMFQYCGRRLRVYKRAHKTCDFVTHTGIRSLPNAVHLENIRCDGSAHGNCQAQCMIFWKEAWLKRVSDQSDPETPHSTSLYGESLQPRCDRMCSEKMVRAACTSTQPGNADPTYTCQATLLPNFTQPLSWWDIRQYVEDYKSGNIKSFRRMLPRFMYQVYNNLINLGIGWGPILRWFYDLFQKFRGGIPYPARPGNIPAGSTTPTCIIGLQPRDLVRVKGYEEILKTLDTAKKNRGMAFSAEMVPYCGKVFRVLSRITRIIDEKTGKMLHLKNPCIILEGVTCQARYNTNMLFCPRATYTYWREIWLEQVTDFMSQQLEGKE
jgi:hypothetical protein